MRSLLLLSCVIAFVACTNHRGSNAWNGSADSIKAQYEVQDKVVGCTTEKHVFSGVNFSEIHKAYCEALQDDKLNKGCAESARQTKFKTECADFTWSPKRSFGP